MLRNSQTWIFVLKEDIPWNIRAEIEEDFENSNLPFLVDLTDWNQCNKKFQQLISENMVHIQKPL